MYFTKEDYAKIDLYLKNNAKKDTDFPSADLPLTGKETMAIVQKDYNVLLPLEEIGPALKEGSITLPKIDPDAIKSIVNTAVAEVDPIIVEGDVTNAPDEEDLTSDSNDLLKFKDKLHSPIIYSGLGKKHLRKNLVNGVNTLTQDMFKASNGVEDLENTIFIIQYDYIIPDDSTIIIPAGCTLQFEGGSIEGSGTLVGQNTIINAQPIKIFGTNLNISGAWNVSTAYPEWFGAKGYPNTNYDAETNTTTNESASLGIQSLFDSPFYNIEFLPGYYYLDTPVYLKYRKNIKMCGKGSHRCLDEDLNKMTTIWTNLNINLLTISLNMGMSERVEDRNDWAVLKIKGGCFNLSKVPDDNNGHYNKSAIIVQPSKGNGMHNAEISTSIIRQGYYNGSLVTSPILDRGNGLKYESAADASSEAPTTAYLNKLDLYCTGFTNGVLVDYGSNTSMTSLEVRGYFDGNIHAVNAISPCFSAGIVQIINQTRAIFSSELEVKAHPVLVGNFTNCLIDSIFWDLSGWDSVAQKGYAYYAIDCGDSYGITLGQRTLSFTSIERIKNPHGILNTTDLQSSSIKEYLDFNKAAVSLNSSKTNDYNTFIDNVFPYLQHKGDITSITASHNFNEGEVTINSDDLCETNYSITLGNGVTSDENKYYELTVNLGSAVPLKSLYIHLPWVSRSTSSFKYVKVSKYQNDTLKYEETFGGVDYRYDLYYDRIIKALDTNKYYSDLLCNKIVIRFYNLSVSTLKTIKFSLEGSSLNYHGEDFLKTKGGNIYGNLSVLGDLNKGVIPVGVVSIDDGQYMKIITSGRQVHISALFKVEAKATGVYELYSINIGKAYNNDPLYSVKLLDRTSTSSLGSFKSYPINREGNTGLLFGGVGNGYAYSLICLGGSNNTATLSFMEKITPEEFLDDELISVAVIGKSGSTRPTSNIYVGYSFFDTTLRKPIYWDGTCWVDSNGLVLADQ